MSRLAKYFYDLRHNFHFVLKMYVKLINFMNYPFEGIERQIMKDYIIEVSDLSSLCKPIKRFYDDYSWDGNLYGIAYNLKKYSKHSGFSRTAYDHGLRFEGGYNNEIKYPVFRRYITMSNSTAKSAFLDTSKPSMAIGPYIRYVEPINNFVKNLQLNSSETIALVFLPHSTVGIVNDLFREFIQNSLEELSKFYDRLIVLVHYKDCKNLEVLNLSNVLVTSVGNNRGKLFLNRLRSLIEVSKYSYSFNIGSHISYCIGLNLPHQLILSPSKYGDVGRLNRFEYLFGPDHSLRYEGIDVQEVYLKNETMMFNSFGASKIHNSLISDEQFLVANALWSNDTFKDSKSIREFLSSG